MLMVRNYLTNSISRSPLRPGFLLIAFAGVLFALSPNRAAQALTTVAGVSFTSYTVRPSATTPDLTCGTGKIGCNGTGAGEWGPYAPNDKHVLYLPHSFLPQYRNNLLVFFNGQNGSPEETNDQIYKVAAHQGY